MIVSENVKAPCYNIYGNYAMKTQASTNNAKCYDLKKKINLNNKEQLSDNALFPHGTHWEGVVENSAANNEGFVTIIKYMYILKGTSDKDFKSHLSPATLQTTIYN